MPAKRFFTIDEMEKLKRSVHVASVTKTTITLTPEFKKVLYNQMLSGLTPEEIFSLNGIDPKTLGTTRIRGIAQRVKDQAVREEGFSDMRTSNHRRPAADPGEDMSDTRRLKRRIAELEAENTELKLRLALWTEGEKLQKKRMRSADVSAGPVDRC